jgi:hypothetical protein
MSALALSLLSLSLAARADDPPKPAPSAAPSTSGDELIPSAGASASLDEQDKRRDYIRSTRRKFEDTLHPYARELSSEERAVVMKHWRLSMRLWRIHLLARAANDTATVEKVEDLLTKLDAKTDAKLKALAPSDGGAR